ncbi:MAG: hypothetical protein LBE13_16535 [Bacteroidales bacterium]|jgi:hypothetical protein|nr:hypothetical protein [Bacteroidales bacterium]
MIKLKINQLSDKTISIKDVLSGNEMEYPALFFAKRKDGSSSLVEIISREIRTFVVSFDEVEINGEVNFNSVMEVVVALNEFVGNFKTGRLRFMEFNHARARFNKVNLQENSRIYLSAQMVTGSQELIKLNDAENLIVIPQDGYYHIDIGPLRVVSSNPAKIEGRLIAKAPGSSDWILLHLHCMEKSGTTYTGFSRILYLTAGTVLEFGLTSDVFTSLVSAGELTDNNELSIVLLNKSRIC